IARRKLLAREAFRGRPKCPLLFAVRHGQAAPPGAKCPCRSSALFHMAAKIWLALFVEGTHALARSFGLVIKIERLHPHRSDAADIVDVGIERAQCSTKGRRSQSRSLR